MTYQAQKKLAKQIFEKLGLNVDLSGCFDDIIQQLTIEQCVQVLNLVDDEYVKSEWAFNVAINKPEHKEKIIDFVVFCEFAYLWALTIGDRDIMINRITDSHYSYLWALNIGNRDIMINRINDSENAYLWARDIGDRDIMVGKITDYEYAFRLIRDLGDKDATSFKVENNDNVFKFI